MKNLAALFLVLSILPTQAATLNRGNGAEPDSLDPHHVGGTWEENIVGDMLIGLTTLDAAARPIPGMAERWEVSKDGLTWTFHLRQALWSDGVPVTADDFVFAWRRLLDPKTASRYAYNMWVVKNARSVSDGKLPPGKLGVTAKNPRTLIVTLAHPAPYLPELLSHVTADPLPRHALARDPDWAKPGHYRANGPYLLKAWLPNDHITLVKNPRFYDAAHVRTDTVNYFPTADSNAALRRFRAGELDMQTPIPSSQVGWMRTHLPKALHILPSLAIDYIAFNLDYPPLKDVRVRRALNLVYDREAMAGKVLKLGEKPAYRYVPPGTAHYPGQAAMDFKALAYPARAALARRLMQDAGYGPFNRLHLIYATTNAPDRRRTAAVFQAMARRIYVDLEIAGSDPQVHLRNLRLGQFQLGASSWLADFNDASNFLDLLRSDAGNNYAHYRNPKFDALMNRAQSEPDGAKRAALMLAAEKQAMADYPWLVTRFLSQSEAVSPRVGGYVPNVRDFNRTRWLWIRK
jgi:oligopeptide transport system substrate-binding protein